MKLHYAGFDMFASGYGWATANSNLVRELMRFCELRDAINAEREQVDIVFMPLADHDFNPISGARGKINLAYTFFEFPLGPNAAENARKYETVFAGSTWCLDRMAEAGITNTKLLIQGVDSKIFRTRPPRTPDGRFRIFSGGKFEYRKGQDLVIAAFKEFSKKRPDAHLVCAWFNPWPHLIQSMNRTEAIAWKPIDDSSAFHLRHFGAAQMGLLNRIMSNAGIAPTEYRSHPNLSQSELSRVMIETDAGLFPNRCEGGTNLVLMEYASCGRKVIANAVTGHSDVAGAISYRIPATEDENHWADQNVTDIVDQLEKACSERNEPEHWNLSAHRSEWSWTRAAETIIAEAKRFL